MNRLSAFARLSVVLSTLAAVAGCANSSDVIPRPTPAPTPAPTSLTQSGEVGNQALDPVPGARVEILDGLASGTIAIADSLGNFVVTGQFGGTTVNFRVSAAGYPTITTAVDIPREGLCCLAFELRYPVTS